MMRATNPTPKATMAPPPSPPPPAVVGSKPMVPKRNQDITRQTPPPPPPPGPLKCPRCDSSNTKFCYYNNYSLSQPRHFCKACKRYWTRGGTLRNVPVGGGCRKNKRVNRKHRDVLQAGASSAPMATRNPNPNNPPLNNNVNISNSSSDLLHSLFYGAHFSTAAAAASYDRDIGAQLVIPSINMHQSTANFLSNVNGFSSFGYQDAAASLMHKVDKYQSLLPYDLQQDCAGANLGLSKDVKVEGIDNNAASTGNIFGSVDLWQANYPFDQALNVANDSSCMCWNPIVGGGACWPDAANSSVAPLI